MKPKVSILVPIYNVAPFIGRCAISLFEQTFDDIEYIFVNDSTPDNSIKILEKIILNYPNRQSNIKIINHQVNSGLAVARNTALENATGEYIIHVDSDDYIENNMAEILYNKAKNEELDILVYDYLLEWDTVKKYVSPPIGVDKTEFIKMLLSSDTIFSVCNKMFKRELYTKNNISTFEGINFGEDYLTSPRLAYFSTKIGKINKGLYHYIQSNDNSYTKNYTKKNIEDVVFVLEELTRFFESKEDFYLYKESLLKGKLRKKIEIIFNADRNMLDKLFLLFPDTFFIETNFLNIHERILFFLIKNRMKLLFSGYKNFYLLLFYFVQFAKGRI
ncbi:glycosyltransferase [Flavobacterium columnare]|uniref:Glycosyltransferase n=1 Tax=Flavobacterium columnare TaxID=996 RepID=A0A437UE69_9FLAO|nr:glycosyltransferase family 2 protein [Flavobacterium columnare]RVU91798.1 glycosyltransferase [Flavobacterium columnare]